MTAGDPQHQLAMAQLLQELRTPLTNIKTALTLLSSKQIKPAQRQKYLDLIRRECDRQNLLITSASELLSFGQGLDPTATLDLALVLPRLLEPYHTMAQERGVALRSEIAPHLPLACCPESWLQRIVRELLHNSLKFTAPGGAIEVLVANAGDYVQLEFRDNGSGIPAPDLPRIFDSFYHSRDAPGPSGEQHRPEGVGLGLTIVQQLLHRCGGSIAVTSQVNTGSRFRVLLPIATS
jgi:two-component system, OmpR family, phosphate regulon sensor histidine kinase PhoR